LTDFYADSEVIKSNPNIIGFNYPNKCEVTIIISKNGGRYRIQSSHYEALLFMTHQIVQRLSDHYNYDIEFFIEDELIFTDYLNTVENHYKLFDAKQGMNDELEKYTSLYTIIQKNLLSKYKVILTKPGKKSSEFKQS
jgi:Bardet-Biedl syndrome 9 protein